mgnify:FL=1
MIFTFNVIIFFLSIIPTILFYVYPQFVLKNRFKNHIMIFILKVAIISMFIYIFIFNFNISNYKIFIVSGYSNFTFFHIIEGLISQKILLRHDDKK